MQDFFISYNKADRHWADGIGDWLDQAGFTTISQAQDFVAGSNFVSEMHNALQDAKRLIMVLSPEYLQAKFPEAEWTAALASDPTNENRRVLPVRVRDCQPPGLLRPLVYVDLVGLSAEDARKRLLAEISSALKGKRRTRRTVASPPPAPMEGSPPGHVSQTSTGDGNILVGGDFVNFQHPPKQKIVVERREGAISSAQEREITGWIEKLAEGTVGMTRKRAFGMWGARFNNRFGLARRGDLPADRLLEAETWYRQQAAILVRKLKTKAPDAWRQARYGAIHQAMTAMGIEKLSYYQQVAVRLKIQPFSSLTELTKRDLDRVYSMALRDARQ